jgi:hypothetical protein
MLFPRIYNNFKNWYLLTSWIILTSIYFLYGSESVNIQHYDVITHKFITMNIYQSYVIYILTFGIYAHIGFCIYYYLIM